MTPEQIKKHEPMNINNLYEEVPVENDYDPIEYLPFGAIVTIDMYGNIIINSLLRPVTRESIEAFLREQHKELKEECERLEKVAKFWQQKYYELNPPYTPPKIDNL